MRRTFLAFAVLVALWVQVPAAHAADNGLGLRAYETGIAVGGAGIALMITGPTLTAFGTDSAGLSIAGLSMLGAGIVMAPAGALVAGHALRDNGVPVRIWPGHVAAVAGVVTIAGIALALSQEYILSGLGILIWTAPFFLAELGFSIAQIAIDARARQRWPAVRLAPAPLRDGAALVVVARL